jgi:hypothetical protein
MTHECSRAQVRRERDVDQRELAEEPLAAGELALEPRVVALERLLDARERVGHLGRELRSRELDDPEHEHARVDVGVGEQLEVAATRAQREVARVERGLGWRSSR